MSLRIMCTAGLWHLHWLPATCVSWLSEALTFPLLHDLRGLFGGSKGAAWAVKGSCCRWQPKGHGEHAEGRHSMELVAHHPAIQLASVLGEVIWVLGHVVASHGAIPYLDKLKLQATGAHSGN